MDKNDELKVAIAAWEMAKAKSDKATAWWQVACAASDVAAAALSERDAAKKALLDVLEA